MPSVSSLGVGSGIDIKSLVDDLVKAEGENRALALDTKEADALGKITAYGTLKGALSEFQTALTDLKSLTSFQKRSAASADEAVFTAAATSEAVASTYEINVTQLAAADKYQSKDFATADTVIGTGVINVQVGSKLGSVTITSATQTLAGIRDAINAKSSDLGISAAVVTVDSGTRLVFTANEAGAANTITITTDDGDANDTDNAGLSQLTNAHMTRVATARSAILTIDSATVTSNSNSVTGAIEGVTLDLLSVPDPAKDVSLSITYDQSAASEKVTEFVDAYNTVFDTVKTLSLYNGEGEDNGVLLGDATLRAVEYGLRRTINNAVKETTGSYSVLAQIGITTNELTGKLSIATGTLNTALATDFDGVGQLFAADDGIAVSMDAFLKQYVESSGIINSRTDGLNSDIDVISEARIDLERYLAKIETRFISQFIAMDQIVASLKNTSDFLTQAMASMPKPPSARDK